jgi:hypothetical protein
VHVLHGAKMQSLSRRCMHCAHPYSGCCVECTPLSDKTKVLEIVLAFLESDFGYLNSMYLADYQFECTTALISRLETLLGIS